MRARVPGVLLAIGSLLAILGVVIGVVNLVHALSPSGQPWATPGARDLHLSAGRWTVYEATDSTTSQPSTRPRQVAVFGPSGSVKLSCAYCGGSRQTLTLGTQTYVGVVTFDAPTDGQYKVTVTSADRSVVVAPGLGRNMLAFAGGFLLAACGGVLAFVSLAWLVIAGIAHRR
jgi:hypothetical protein